ncbi:PI-PLC domain-containing protein [Taibaiella koreensis]|uniref:hypothetical protein n=1 Tax=Taibaiella koreensis TaxID=1268548 RepID=UPI000E59A69F|nr:hypothetical protein [Taibaiella koreensis]
MNTRYPNIFFHGLSLYFLLIILAPFAGAQQLSFQQPVQLTPQARSDKGVALLHTAGEYLAAWKSPGDQGKIHMASWLDNESPNPREIVLDDAVTRVQPALVNAGTDRYLLWLDTAGVVRYKHCAGQCQWEALPVQVLAIVAGTGGDGLIAVSASGKIVLVNRTRGKDRQWMAVLSVTADGKLHPSSFRELKGNRSAVLNGMAVVNGAVRCYRSNGSQISYQDYDEAKDVFGPEKVLVSTAAITAMTCFFDEERSISLWRSRSDRQWYYQVAAASGSGEIAAVPGFLNASTPVSTCSSQAEDVLIAYTGADSLVYVAYGDAYDPASWMGATLFPGKAHYTLKDIVLPGAHDAGMSILNGLGGKSTYTINECNTLTQKLSVAQQLRAGIRMFDLRIDHYQGALYTKHAPSDCMDDAVGGGYGERLDSVLHSVKRFLEVHPQEIVLLSFCHFCDRRMSIEEQGKSIAAVLGTDRIFYPAGRRIGEIPLQELAGKVIVSFEEYDLPQYGIVLNTMKDQSDAFFNYKRSYAGTNSIDTLFRSQRQFFSRLKGKVDQNDIIRVDWQLTQIGQEAALSCSQFQSEDANLLLDGALLLINAIKKNKSIISLALWANRYLDAQLQGWMKDGIIDRENKPNILYVDVAGSWITDICVGLNRNALYHK